MSQETLRKHKHAIIALAVLAGCCALGLGGYYLISTNPFAASPAAVAAAPKPDPYREVSLAAKSAIVYDTTTGEILYAKNAEAQLPLASLTKLMTAYLALSQLEEGAVIEITPEDVALGNAGGIVAGESYSPRELVAATLITSSNAGAEALGRALEKAHSSLPLLAGETAKKLGLAQTYFVNASGLDEREDFAGAYGSARDIAVLLSAFYQEYPEVAFESTKRERSFQSLAGAVHLGKNTNETVDLLPQALASKTGFTDLAGGNLAVLIDAGVNHPVAIVVLGSTKDERESDVRALVEATRDALARPRVLPAE